MAAGLLVLVGDLQRELNHRTAIGVDPELALADVHLHDVLDLRVGVVLDELDDRLVREVLHAEDPDCERDLVGDVAQADRIELALPDRLHLAGRPDDPDLVEAVRPGRLLDERDVRAEVVLRPAGGIELGDRGRHHRAGAVGLVAGAGHDRAVDDPLLEREREELGDDAAVLRSREDCTVGAACGDAGRVVAKEVVLNHHSHLRAPSQRRSSP